MNSGTSLLVVLALLGSGVALSAGMAGMNMDKPAVAAVEKPQTHRTVGVIWSRDL